MSNPNPLSAPLPAPRWLVGLGLVALVALSVFLFQKATAIAAGSDSSGYLNSARLLASGELSTPHRLPPELGADLSPFHFIPLGFWTGDAGQIVPTYPIGVPAHFALAGKVLGWTYGPLLVVVLFGVSTVWLCYLCAREIGISAPLAFAGATILALSPIYLFSSMQALSDTPATAWSLATVWFALRARRGSTGWAAASGVALAIAVLVRPTSILLLPAHALLLGNWRRLFAAAAGGIPGALWLLYYNNLLYGGPFNTGYGDIAVSLKAEMVFPTLIHIGLWLSRLLPAGLLLLPLAAWPLVRKQWRFVAALALWWIPCIIFYSYYEVTHETWWCLRFILPAIPALILAALLGVEEICRRRAGAHVQRWQLGAALGLCVWAGAVAHHWIPRFGLLHFNQQEVLYVKACDWANANLPPNALVATLPASGSLYFYTNFMVMRWDIMSAADYERYAPKLKAAGRPVYALLFPGEAESALSERMPDQWEKIHEVSGVSFWKLAGQP